MDEGQIDRNDRTASDQGGGPPATGRPLTRAEVEGVLNDRCEWGSDNPQVLKRIHLNVLMAKNGRMLNLDRPTAKGLPLLAMRFEENINLQFVDFRGADLRGCMFKGADFRGANLRDTQLHGALLGTLLLDGIEWSENHECPEEKLGEKIDDYAPAHRVYRSLKRAHENAGIYDVADQFAYREQVVRKKQALQEKRWSNWASLQFAELLFGYGYRWRRVVVSALFLYLIFTLIYVRFGLFAGQDLAVVGKSFYFSAVSFTAVGYGAWVQEPLSALKYLGAFEAIVGVFLIALFLVTFTRQYLR